MYLYCKKSLDKLAYNIILLLVKLFSKIFYDYVFRMYS